jgi:hypothetical protein
VLGNFLEICRFHPEISKAMGNKITRDLTDIYDESLNGAMVMFLVKNVNLRELVKHVHKKEEFFIRSYNFGLTQSR